MGEATIRHTSAVQASKPPPFLGKERESPVSFKLFDFESSSTVPCSAMQDVPKAEQPVLEKLISLRQRLQLLNKDRTKYIKSQDVVAIYDQLIDQVQKLNNIRQHPIQHGEENRLDTVLDDVFQLLSLCFMAAGKNFSSPSVYVQAATIKVLFTTIELTNYSVYWIM